MATITKTFTYEGGVRLAEVPPGTTALTMHLWAGAGGGGGNDVSPGGSGSAGTYVTKTDLDMTAYAGVKNISVSVGGGGAAGTSGAGADGGANGKSITDYSGGQGGDSGSDGPSGSGGGGGGATVVTVFDDGAAITQTVLAVAGGGAGGGGGGAYVSGGTGANTNTATSASPGTLGENGAGHSANGGGAGAGGGGADGGTGGSGDQGDVGGFGGKAGSDTVPSSGSADKGSGITPGGSGSGYYATGVALGGTAQKNGGDGRAVLIFTLPSKTNYKVGGEWKSVNGIFNKVSGAWKEVVAGYYKVSGAWKAIYATDILFSINYAAFGNDTGNPTSGTAGSAGQPNPDYRDGDPGGDRNVPPRAKKMYWGPITINSPKGYQTESNRNNGRVICTWLSNHGMMSEEDLMIDNIYSVKNISVNTKLGYWFWAVPYVRFMDDQYKKQTTLGKYLVKWSKAMAQARTNEIKREMGYIDTHDYGGKITRIIGENLSTALGFIVKPFIKQRFSKWLSETDPRKMDW
jgi:hypothetical protein